MSNESWSVRDAILLDKAIKLAGRGRGSVEPNPAVGAVLVKNGRIIARGYHKTFGGPHAEINAIRNAKKRSQQIKGATLYVTLEPCCHTGKTPPCTQAVIAEGIKTVVVGSPDPSPKVNGKGIGQLRKAGIEVRIAPSAAECENINPWFYKFHRTHKPWVVAKWAQTLDGKLAARSGHAQWISCPESRVQTHRLRKTCQAILVGINTIRADNPRLTVRLDEKTHNPNYPLNRVVFDSNLKISQSSVVVQSAGEFPTWICTSENANGDKIRKLTDRGVHVIRLKRQANGRISLNAFLKFAATQGWMQILVEGGPTLLSSFISQNLADELVIFQSPLLAMDKQAKQFHSKANIKVSDFIHKFKFYHSCNSENDLILRLWRT